VNTPLTAGQCLQHARFGIGVASHSDKSRTTIDFYDHGVRTFVTSMLEVELMTEAPHRPKAAAKPRANRKPAK
jgi:hypothetical protein